MCRESAKNFFSLGLIFSQLNLYRCTWEENLCTTTFLGNKFQSEPFNRENQFILRQLYLHTEEIVKLTLFASNNNENFIFFSSLPSHTLLPRHLILLASRFSRQLFSPFYPISKELSMCFFFFSNSSTIILVSFLCYYSDHVESVNPCEQLAPDTFISIKYCSFLLFYSLKVKFMLYAFQYMTCLSNLHLCGPQTYFYSLRTTAGREDTNKMCTVTISCCGFFSPSLFLPRTCSILASRSFVLDCEPCKKTRI